MKKTIVLLISLFIGFTVLLSAQQKNKVKYTTRKGDKVFGEILEKQAKVQEKKDEETGKIRQRQAKEAGEEDQRMILSDSTGLFPPKSPEEFKQYFYFPPQAQDFTNTCWTFAATSYLESEIFRLTGKKIKLSEMWAVYFGLIDKCRRYIDERGNSHVAGGGEPIAAVHTWKQHGIVPLDVYPGVLEKGDRHNHAPMMEEVISYLTYINRNNLWNEEENMKHITLILDNHLGKPPESFTYNGKTMTPVEFLQNETGLNPDDYYSVISTLYFPFYTRGEFRVPDNWSHSKEYINLPLDVWYGIVKKAVPAGQTLVMVGDVTEAGKLAEADIAFIPTFDIPEKYIDQDSREYRIYNKTTEDDHAIHVVGYKQVKGKDWYLIKDSARSSRYGKYPGYYFFRGDFIKLKMLAITVHKDLLKDILPELEK